jgi:hypothetical protein
MKQENRSVGGETQIPPAGWYCGFEAVEPFIAFDFLEIP